MIAGNEVAAELVLQKAEERLARRDLPAAFAAFNEAEKLGARADRCAGGRWMAFMLQGDFEAAWCESDAIRRRAAPDAHRFWNGQDIRGKRVIVRCLHGFGDAVQFLRYAPALRSRASEVIFEVPPRLVELAPHFDGVDRVITWGDRAPQRAPHWDVQMEVMELPYYFRTVIDELPRATQYLRPPGEARARIAERMGHSRRPRVGLVWSAGQWNQTRNLPFHLLAQLLDNAEVEFWNLQGVDSRDEEPYTHQSGLREIMEYRDSILALAAAISQLDLVITVDTLAAHLAGALGVPAWVLLQFAADWRWMTGTTESPWYPSLRLFRQARQNDWQFVIDDVGRALQAWSRSRDSRLIAS